MYLNGYGNCAVENAIKLTCFQLLQVMMIMRFSVLGKTVRMKTLETSC